MKNLFFALAFILSGSSFASEWWDMTHSLNEVSILDCKIMVKNYSSKRWKKLVHLSDIHSGMNDRTFTYSKHLIDEFRRDRYLVMKMSLNSWDYELEDIETGEWKNYRRTGRTTITFKIEDRWFTTTTSVHNAGITVRDVAKLERTVHDGISKKSYRLICGERP